LITLDEMIIMQAIQFVPNATSTYHNIPRLPERQTRCSGCSLHDICLPTGLGDSDMQRLDNIMVRRRIPRDTVLYRMGDPFTSLYAIRLGHFKTYQINPSGEQQIC